MLTVGKRQGANDSVQRLHFSPQPQFDALRPIPGGIRQLQRLGRLAAEHLGQMHPVVGGVRLGTKYRHLEPVKAASRHQLLDKVVAHHAVADHQQTLFLTSLERFDQVVVHLIIHTVAHHQQFLFVSHISLP